MLLIRPFDKNTLVSGPNVPVLKSNNRIRSISTGGGVGAVDLSRTGISFRAGPSIGCSHTRLPTEYTTFFASAVKENSRPSASVTTKSRFGSEMLKKRIPVELGIDSTIQSPAVFVGP